ncbi:RNA polymerase sigma factor [Pedobacter sp. GR22-6]|uniref:RNA polymerase sigma factor n=1 Tax=Pedobacter sp. GR22-6 TaxID=3127957 RepID=UPI00307CD38B
MELYGKLTDAELLLLIKEGDELAFTQVYNTYWDKLFYIAAKKLKDQDEAEEAVQDIFLKLWENKAQLQLKENFESYLVSATHYQIINRKQKAIRRAIIEQKLGKATDEEIKLSQLPDLSQEYFEQLQARLDKVVQTLPTKCQLVFKMSRSEEYTNKKIAAELGISEKAVEKHVTHALKVLKENLGPSAMIIITIHELLK